MRWHEGLYRSGHDIPSHEKRLFRLRGRLDVRVAHCVHHPAATFQHMWAFFFFFFFFFFDERRQESIVLTAEFYPDNLPSGCP
jgi:hypothetical protein